MGYRSPCHGVFRGRVRQQERDRRRLGYPRPWFLPSALVLLVLTLVSTARAGFDPRWTLDVVAGHDDQILADAEALGVVRSVSDAYFNGSSRFLVHIEDVWKPDRLDLSVEGAGVVYGSKVLGEDTNLAGSGAYRRHLSDHMALDVSGSGYRFRRAETADGRPVFDFNLYRGEVRLGWAATPRWLWTVGILHDWIRFPGRPADLDSTAAEDQRQFNLSVAALRRFGEAGYLAGRLNYRWTTSSVRFSEYEGPVLSLRARASLPHHMDLLGYIAASHRGYHRFLSADSLGLRRDNTWQFGVRLSRPVHPRVSVFLDGAYLHQKSNLEVFAYNQSRVALGVTVDLIAPPSRPPVFRPGPPPMAPVQDRRGVLFRFRDPRAASVSVVGGWNAWDAEAHPLAGPDPGGVWEIRIPLKPGIWRYAFVVDGTWITPPGALRYEDDGFGGRNGVLVVPTRRDPVTGEQETRRNQ